MPQQRRHRGPQRGRPSGSSQRGEPSSSPAAPQAEAPSWWERAGSWIADTYEDVSTAVGDTIDTVSDTVSDTWDVLASSDMDVNWRERKLSVSTDMDEVLDLMPADVQAALQLDREAAGANEVEMELDYRGNAVTIVSKDLRINAVDTPELSAGRTSLSNVRITLRGDGGLPLVGNAKSTGVEVSIGGASAEQVRAVTDKGVLTAARLALGPTELAVTGRGPELPTGETGSARFSVANATVEGFSSGQGAAQNLQVDGLSGALDQEAGTGFVSADRIGADGASAQGHSLGSTSVEGARVDMRQTAAGVQHEVSVRDAVFGDVTTASGDHLAGANISGLSGQLGGGQLDLAARELGVRDLSGANQLRAAQLNDLSVSASGIDGQDWTAQSSVGNLSVEGFAAGNLRLDQLDASGLSTTAAGGVGGPTFDAGLDRVQGRGLSLNRFGMGAFWGAGVEASSAEGGVRASATRFDAAALQAGDVSVDTIGVDHFSTLQRGRNDASYQAGRVRASGIGVQDTSVGSLDASGISADTRNQIFDAQVRQLQAGDLRHGQHSVGSLSASGLNAAGGQGNLNVGLDQARVEQVRAALGEQELLLQSGAINGLSLDRSGDQLRADVLRTDLTEGSFGAHRFGSIGIDGLSAGQDASGWSGGFSLLDARRLSTSGASLDSALVRGASGHHGAAGSGGSIEQIDLTGVNAAGASLDRASLGGLSGSHGPDGSRVDLREVGMVGLSRDGMGAESLWARNLYGAQSQGVTTGGLDALGASGLYAPGTTLDDLTLSRLTGRHAGQQTTLGLGALDANGLSHRSGNMSMGVGGVNLRGGGATFGPDGREFTANSLGAHNLSGGATLSGGGGGGMDPDTLRQLAMRVEDADIRASVPMLAGDYAAGSQNLGVSQGTRLDASVAIRDGALVPGAVRADFSNNLDGPLWVGVRGAYLDTDGALRANLAGAPNLNIGKSMGLGKRIDPRLSTLLSPPATGSQRGGGSSGRTAQQPSTTPSIDRALDTGGMTVDANVYLRDGGIGVGGNSANLVRERATDNAVHVEGGGERDLVATFARFLTSSLRLGVGGTDVQAGGAAVEQGRVSVDPNAQGGTAVDGTVGSVTLRDLRARQ